MAVGLTEEHLALAESVRRWAERSSPREVVRAAAGSGDGGAAQYRDVLRPGLAELGLPGLHVPEEHGGQGYGLPELAVALEELGRALVPGAFLPTVLASAALTVALRQAPGKLGDAGKLIAGLADGSRTGAVSLAAGLTGRRDEAGGLAIDGSSAPVPAAALADLLILPVQVASGSGAAAQQEEIWIAADAAGLAIAPLDSLDLTRPAARVTAAGTAVPAGRVLSGLDRATVSGLAATMSAAEACGIAGWAVHTAAAYAKIREQFGRPIGQFQAVKHRCARMLTVTEQAAAAVWDAARAHADGRTPAAQRELAASVAAVIALDAAVSCAHDAIQVLGGIGYTWEHDAHLYYRRALSLRALLGPSGDWAGRVAELSLAGVRRPLEVDLPAGAQGLRERIRAEAAELAKLDGPEQTRRLAEAGWVMPHLPRPWGRAADPVEQILIAQEKAEMGVRTPRLAIGDWAVPALVRYGTREQQERFLPPTLRGELIWCQLFSEPGAGSDLAAVSTRAQRADGGWRLTGQKVWTSLARQASWAICIARSDPGAPKHDGITYFLVDMSSPGIEVRPLREITGDSIFNEVTLDDVFVPDDRVVGEVNGGWKVARTTLANERVALSSAWAYGSGLTELLELAGARERSGQLRPAGQEQLGRLVCEGHAVDLLGLRITLKRLSGTEPGATASVRKLLGMQQAQRIADFCWALLGPEGAANLASAPEAGAGDAANDLGPGWQPGFTPDLSGPGAGGYWSRQVLFTRALTIGGGTTDVQLNIIGERLLGLPRDP
jgi:alkylation response protein AidB-like acyl-CoA dehydrogenase